MSNCSRCGYRLPFHKPECGENFACSCPPVRDPDACDACECPASNHPLRDEANRLASLPGRPAYEVTQRSRFEEET